ncbi:MAG: hypothetical protein IPL62_11985 [Caulobacteraceae bacterium]|nr:hypothetical protein [Caulobacteraceae bacterium]
MGLPGGRRGGGGGGPPPGPGRGPGGGAPAPNISRPTVVVTWVGSFGSARTTTS